MLTHKQMELIISFIISILANNVPSIRELLEENQSLKDAIDKAYHKALERWCVNDGIRESIGDKYNSIDNLRDYFESKSDLSVDEQRLISLWAEELRNDNKTYNKILEIKIDSLSSTIKNIQKRLDLECIYLPDDINSQNQALLSNVHEGIIIDGKSWAINRENLLKDIDNSFGKYRFLVLVGEGGSGKSAVIKQLIRKRNTPTIYLKADQFQCSDINVLFHYDRNYDASIVKEFFSKDQDKLIVIDSAEDIFRLENKKCLLLFIDSFARDGWKFLFAVRSAEAKNLNSYIESLVKTKVYSVQVKTLSDDDLRRFLNQNKLPIPSNRHLRERLTNLFYLSQYVSIKGQANSTLSDFKEVVWEKKVKGGDNETRARQESREQNLFLLVEEYNRTGRSIISPQGLSLDYSSIDGLEKDEVIVSIPHLGYSFAHDIFIDWAEEFIISRKWYESNHDVDAFLIQLDNNIVTRNAFSRWFDDKVESNDNSIKEFIQKAMDNRIETAWMKSVVASVLKYKDSSESFVRHYEETLLKNGGQLFFTVLNILCVQCVVIDRYVSYEEKQFPIMKPKGYGWDATAKFLLSAKGIDLERHHDIVYNFLYNFSNKTDSDMSLRHDIGMFILQPYINIMENEQDDKYFVNRRKICTLVGNYSLPLIKELTEIIRKVVDNKWFRYNDPYSDLMSYIVKAEESEYANYPLYKESPDDILALMSLFWMRPSSVEKSNEYRGVIEEEFEVWGLNCYVLNSLSYFPASAYQTCILPMLNFHPDKTLDFIIKLMNYCIGYYAKSHWLGERCEDIVVKFNDGKVHHVYGTAACWCMVRGSSAPVTPYPLQSIHMALEKYLLDSCKDKDRINEVKGYLDKILFDSNSVTLYAVVASVAKAYPDYFLDELLVIASNLTLLTFDDESTARERSISYLDFVYNGHAKMLKERSESNKVHNRSHRIGRVLLDVQYNLNENGTDVVDAKRSLEKIYTVIDDLKVQLRDIESPLNLKGIISELDYRSMTKKDVKVNGIPATILTQNLDEEQEKASKAIQEQQEQQTPWLAAINWIIAKWESKKDVLKNNLYEKEPKKALELAKTYMAVDKTDKKRDFIFFPGDRYIPIGICSLMVQFYYDDLSEDDKALCVNTIIQSLKSPEFMCGSYFVKLSNVISIIDRLLTLRPDLNDEYSNILLVYSTIKEKFQGVTACNIVSNFIYTCRLWDGHREFMRSVVNKFLENEEQIKKGILNHFQYYKIDYLAEIWKSESLLCIIPCFVGDEEIDKLALEHIEKISHIWDRKNEYKNCFVGHKSDASTIIARYLLSADETTITKIVSMFVDYLHSRDVEDILDTLIVYVILDNTYDNFWIIWDKLYPYIVNSKNEPVSDEVFKSFLLNPNLYSDQWQDWFKFDKRGLDFYIRIAHDRGKDSRVLLAIVKNTTYIGKDYTSQLIPLISEMVTKNSYKSVFNNDTISASVFYLQKIVTKELLNNEQQVKDNSAYRQCVLNILSFMENNGSAWAAEMMRDF